MFSKFNIYLNHEMVVKIFTIYFQCHESEASEKHIE